MQLFLCPLKNHPTLSISNRSYYISAQNKTELDRKETHFPKHKTMFKTGFLVVFLSSQYFVLVDSHAKFLEPPSRASMWRRGFDTPKNYDDNQGYCGGRVYQKKLKGKCGICGDPWDAKVKVGIQWCQIGMMRMVIQLKSFYCWYGKFCFPSLL